MYYIEVIMPVCFGIAYYRLGEIEYERGALIGSLSGLRWLLLISEQGGVLITGQGQLFFPGILQRHYSAVQIRA